MYTSPQQAFSCTWRHAGLAAVPVGEITLAQQAWILRETETKFAQHTTNRRFWAIFRALGELCHARPNTPGRAGRQMTRTAGRNMATLKPTTPLHTPNKGPLKPASPLRGQTAPQTPISHPQRRWWFQSHTDTSEQRRQGFHTTGPPHLQHPNAVPVAAAGPGLRKVARNLTWSFFEMAYKRCNSNDLRSRLEAVLWELRATLLGNHSGTSNKRTHRCGGHRRN